MRKGEHARPDWRAPTNTNTTTHRGGRAGGCGRAGEGRRRRHENSPPRGRTNSGSPPGSARAAARAGARGSSFPGAAARSVGVVVWSVRKAAPRGRDRRRSSMLCVVVMKAAPRVGRAGGWGRCRTLSRACMMGCTSLVLTRSARRGPCASRAVATTWRMVVTREKTCCRGRSREGGGAWRGILGRGSCWVCMGDRPIRSTKPPKSPGRVCWRVGTKPCTEQRINPREAG